MGSLYKMPVRNVERVIDFGVTNWAFFLTQLLIYLSSEWSSILLERVAGMLVACGVCMHHLSSLFLFLWSLYCYLCKKRLSWERQQETQLRVFFGWHLDHNLGFMHRNVSSKDTSLWIMKQHNKSIIMLREKDMDFFSVISV